MHSSFQFFISREIKGDKNLFERERDIETTMAVRIAIGTATKPQLIHHFRSSISSTAGNYRLAAFKASASFSSSPEPKKLILYSKPGCCLCDGLKEKLDAAFSLSSPNSIGDIDLQVQFEFPRFFPVNSLLNWFQVRFKMRILCVCWLCLVWKK